MPEWSRCLRALPPRARFAVGFVYSLGACEISADDPCAGDTNVPAIAVQQIAASPGTTLDGAPLMCEGGNLCLEGVVSPLAAETNYLLYATGDADRVLHAASGPWERACPGRLVSYRDSVEELEIVEERELRYAGLGVIEAEEGSLVVTQSSFGPGQGVLGRIRTNGELEEFAGGAGGWGDVAGADFDGDGTKDVVVVKIHSDDGIYEATPMLLLAVASTSMDPVSLGEGPFEHGCGSAGCVAAGDIDGDQKADLILRTDAGLVRRLGDGAGQFEDAEFVVDGRAPLLASFDGEEQLQLVVEVDGAQDSRSLRVIPDPMAPDLGAYELPTPGERHYLAAVDIDDDGDSDLVAATAAGPEGSGMVVYLNDGGVLTFASLFPFEGIPTAISAAGPSPQGSARVAIAVRLDDGFEVRIYSVAG